MKIIFKGGIISLSLSFFLILSKSAIFAQYSNNKGSNWHLGAWYNTINSPNEYDFIGIYQDLDHMKTANMKWVRISINQATQTTCDPDPLHPTKFYSLIRDAAKARGIHILATISIPNALTVTGSSTERASYLSWINVMVNCYKNDFAYWEIHNEPNLHYFWNINENTTDNTAYAQSVHTYLLYLKDSYTTIKAINPNLHVVLGGLAQGVPATRFINAAKNDVISPSIDPSLYVDSIGFHPYSDTGSTGVINELNTFNNVLMTSPGLASKPIWIDEFGFTASASTWPGNTGGSETLKAQYLTESYQKLYDWGIDYPILWYDFATDPSIGTPGYGLETTDRNTRVSTYSLAYTAMKNLWPDPPLDQLTPTPTPTPSCPKGSLGDLDCSGGVGITDLSGLLSSFGKRTGDTGFNPKADLDGSGQVGITDLSTLLSNFGK